MFTAEATDCYRCSYTKADEDLVDSSLKAALAAAGVVNDATCQANPSNETEGTCPEADASCGTVQATLSLNVELGKSLSIQSKFTSKRTQLTIVSF